MEEQVGLLWHRLVTRLARTGHPGAAVVLGEVDRSASVLFRALGGDAALRLAAIDDNVRGGRRGLLQRLAGSHHGAALAWRDDDQLYMPARIDLFEEAADNRALFLWLAALAAVDVVPQADWLADAQRRVQATLSRYPGLVARYRRLVDRHLRQRPDPGSLGRDAALERAIQAALRSPGSVNATPWARRAPLPVPLWLSPERRIPVTSPRRDGVDQDGEPVAGGKVNDLRQPRRRGELVDPGDAERGLVTIRMENILTFGEFVSVDRGAEDEEDAARSEDVARDLDRVAISRTRDRRAARLRFDLDLPAEADDDRTLTDGLLLPEWDFQRSILRPDRCRVVELEARDTSRSQLPPRLAAATRSMRRRFGALAPARQWQGGQLDGDELDHEAYQRHLADRANGHAVAGDRLYRALRQGHRDLACLLLADLSLSTDAHVDNEQRVVDVIRDSLYLFAEALDSVGDRFAMYGFSSRRRDPVRVHRLKTFDEDYGGRVRGRIAALRPGFYTRLGAGIRYAAGRLGQQPARRRLLLILTDGKPNDLDAYEGRYGIEDTRAAVVEARRAGLLPFCVSIDRDANAYLSYLFGVNRYVAIRKPGELPARLAALYALLTR